MSLEQVGASMTVMTDVSSSAFLMMSRATGSDRISGCLSDGRSSASFEGWLELLSLLRLIAAGAGVGEWKERRRHTSNIS